jgi:methionyl-tRNA formyltransferase
MKLLLMADSSVGVAIFNWLFREYPLDITIVITTSKNEIYEIATNSAIPCIVYESTEQILSHVEKNKMSFDVGLLAWWPKIIKHPLVSLPKYGFINTHPSLLPHNRGKHYNFWSLVEQTPFGVSLHFVDDGIDSGDVISQTEIKYDWEDTGATLYSKAQEGMLILFKKSYPKIRSLNIPRRKQVLSEGSFHLAKEIDNASLIDLNRKYIARDLLNLLRARTFLGKPACSFQDDGIQYEIRVDIKRIKHDTN